MGRFLGDLWKMWTHGLGVAVIVALCLLAAALQVALPLAVIDLLRDALGYPEWPLDKLTLWLSVVWVPLGLSFAARYIPPRPVEEGARVRSEA